MTKHSDGSKEALIIDIYMLIYKLTGIDSAISTHNADMALKLGVEQGLFNLDYRHLLLYYMGLLQMRWNGVDK